MGVFIRHAIHFYHNKIEEEQGDYVINKLITILALILLGIAIPNVPTKNMVAIQMTGSKFRIICHVGNSPAIYTFSPTNVDYMKI